MTRVLLTIIVGAFFLAILPLGSMLESQMPTTPLSVERIRDGIYMAKGGVGANTGFFIGSQGVLAIDSKMTADASKQVVAEIAKLTPLPVVTMVLTHSDLDHVNGLNGFPQGMKIIAHEQTKADMAKAFAEPSLQPLQAFLPNQTFTDKLVLDFGGETIQLLHFGPAHTSGDVVVYFPKEKVAFIGDLAFIGRDPLIHLQKGGTSFGLVKNLAEILKLDADVLISGHSDPLNKSQIDELMKSIEDKQAKVKALAAEGKSLAEVKAAFNIKDEPSPGGRRWPSLVEIIYQELTEKK
jgi:glyoxylase-like metal-dependent hydrolase (beta-lactamase superfamily II)